MAPKYWMITDRNVNKDGLGPDFNSRLSPITFWVSDGQQPIDQLNSWQSIKGDGFKKLLADAATKFPLIPEPENNEAQQHVTLFIHGFDNSWESAAKRYQSICTNLFNGPDSLGICILYTWPSDGMVTNYLPDRKDAQNSAPHLAEILSILFDWLIDKQIAGVQDPTKACRAKTSIIAHSMGNFVLQKAMQLIWTRKNQPLLVSLFNQILMVAADVDNDLFISGEKIDKSDGDAIANLTYRITALYSGRDSVLGLSAGLKHFGKRRLGRSGLDDPNIVPDNVWDIDCSSLISPQATNVHSAYFEEDNTIKLMRKILKGIDRNLVLP